MADDAEIRQNIRCQLFACVGELADREHQRATWLDLEMQNPHYTFVEFFECFYDVVGASYDSDDPEAKGAPFQYLIAKGYISAAERDAVWPLHMALRGYEWPVDAYDHRPILGDPAWYAVTEAASKARAALIALLDDASEHACFDNESPSPAQKRWP